ncbi:hypothetical protein [Baekduia sp. Peel2402]|uniref:hypothetical protein n=1 Tax=Baekduia sp. Peel2402 TaxID=3458296 RepID=UPI00403E7888
MTAAFRRYYGASPLHLLGHLVAFAIAYYALSEVLLSRYSHWINWVAWFVGGALLHDLVFLPIYVLLDAIARLGVVDHPLRQVNAINHIRVPAVMAGVMFLVFFPLILGDGRENYVKDVGHAPPDFLARWLLICAILFSASALVYAIRLRRSRA